MHVPASPFQEDDQCPEADADTPTVPCHHDGRSGGITIVPRHVLGGPRFVAPSNKVNVAIMGAGGQGLTNAPALFHEDDCQIIALANPAEEWDLSTFYCGGKSGRGPVKAEIERHYARKTQNHRVAAYEDFGVMLEKEKGIDAVLIATPDHLMRTPLFSR